LIGSPLDSVDNKSDSCVNPRQYKQSTKCNYYSLTQLQPKAELLVF